VIEAQRLQPFRDIDAEIYSGILVHAVPAAPVLGEPAAHALLGLRAQLTARHAVDGFDRSDRVAHQLAERYVDKTLVIGRAILVDPPQ